MVEIQESIIINARPEAIWNFLTRLHEDGNYRSWHPEDHIEYRILKGDMQQPGSMAYFREYLGKRILAARYVLTKAQYPTYLEYEPAPPLNWFHTFRAFFRMEPIDVRQTEFIAYVGNGYRVPVLGRLVDYIVHNIYDTTTSIQHIREEGKNIKRITETRT